MYNTYKLTVISNEITKPHPKSNGFPYYRVEMDNGKEKIIGIFTYDNCKDICILITTMFWMGHTVPFTLPIEVDGISFDLN